VAAFLDSKELHSKSLNEDLDVGAAREAYNECAAEHGAKRDNPGELARSTRHLIVQIAQYV